MISSLEQDSPYGQNRQYPQGYYPQGPYAQSGQRQQIYNDRPVGYKNAKFEKLASLMGYVYVVVIVIIRIFNQY